MNVDRVLRESTRALTFTLPNSVTDAFGIFSVSSRSRSAEGFHSTDAAFTCCPTVAPPPGRGPCPARVLPAVGHACLRPKLRDLGSVPGKTLPNAGRVARYAEVAAGTGTRAGGSDARGTRLTAARAGRSGPERLPLGASGNERKRHRE